MKVSELIAMLEDCDPNAEVRLATQPNYPVQSHLRGVAMDDSEDADGFPAEGEVVYLVEGSQDYDHPYAPSWVFDNVMIP